MAQNEELLDALSSEVETANRRFSFFAREMDQIRNDVSSLMFGQQFQLTPPLDPSSQRVIKDLLVFPISHSLVGQNAQSASLYGIMFSADRPYVLESVAESHGTAAGSGSLQLIRAQAGESLAQGDNLLSTTFDLTASAGTARVRNLNIDGGLSTAQGVLVFEKGDRLGLRPSGSLSSIQDLNITAYFKLF